ncbi:MAG: DUF5615 family PIN-like protein [Planctomycetia bacterium]|nr:DUF5615 family PIN-like protein [Planctomycetia bacterium]
MGDPIAADHEIMEWARNNEHMIFTHDLDFGTMLALTHASGPNVIQVRGQNVLPDHMAPTRSPKRNWQPLGRLVANCRNQESHPTAASPTR